jgi:hypothetical protein
MKESTANNSLIRFIFAIIVVYPNMTGAIEKYFGEY